MHIETQINDENNYKIYWLLSVKIMFYRVDFIWLFINLLMNAIWHEWGIVCAAFFMYKKIHSWSHHTFAEVLLCGCTIYQPTRRFFSSKFIFSTKMVRGVYCGFYTISNVQSKNLLLVSFEREASMHLLKLFLS